MRKLSIPVGAAVTSLMLGSGPVAADEPLWAIQVENAEYRGGDNLSVFAWDLDAYVGSDEFKVVWRSEGEFDLKDETFETLENQIRGQVPISTFFDAVAGVRVDTTRGSTRAHAVVGVKGLAPQWFEIDADFYISDYPEFRFEAEYEALLTNRIILTPSVEISVPFRDDPAMEVSAFGPKLEVGLRVSYDLIDRAVSPYVGVHYERVFGGTADLVRAGGEDAGELFFVAGVRFMY